MLSSPDRIQGRELPLPQKPGLETRTPQNSDFSGGVIISESHKEMGPVPDLSPAC